LPFRHNFIGRRNVSEVERDFFVSDKYLLDNAFDDLPALQKGKIEPAAVEILGLRDDLLARQVLNFQVVDLPLEAGNLLPELLLPFLERPVTAAETLYIQAAIYI
jgi:hypothetical protein